MLRRTLLFLNFYSLFATVTLSVTGLCAFLLCQLGFKPFFYIFWFKIITLAIGVYAANQNRRNLFYYYKNLGFSIPALWAGSILLDLMIFVGIVVLIVKMS